jgi:hypothetical protein
MAIDYYLEDCLPSALLVSTQLFHETPQFTVVGRKGIDSCRADVRGNPNKKKMFHGPLMNMYTSAGQVYVSPVVSAVTCGKVRLLAPYFQFFQ